MTHIKTQNIKRAHDTYMRSQLYTLNDCYVNHSYAKERAFDYCRTLVSMYNGRQGRIIGANCMTFSYGFIGEINGRPAFFWITRDYDRYIYIDELVKE
ncbi:MAG: hypothetical protein J6S23_02660 [Clostridia bacterium]|nr:hypothetical protein [Clostridia bacterium]